MHLAKPNTTDRDRAVHTIIYFPDGSTRGYPFPHFSVDRGSIAVGEAIDSDATPIAFPRPDGEPIPPLPAVPLQIGGSIAARKIIEPSALPGGAGGGTRTLTDRSTGT